MAADIVVVTQRDDEPGWALHHIEGLEREKFLINGQRIDVVTYGRLASDPTPRIEPLPITTVPNSE